MSDPTGGERQQPVPDPDNSPEEVQDQTPDPVYNDPTAPVWADPTTPIPPVPPAPAPASATHPQGDQPASSPQQPPPAAPPTSNPYAQQQPGQPYAQQPPAQGYGQPQPPYSPYGQQPYATGPHTEANASAIVLTILSGIIMMSTCFTIGVPSLIFGIMALTSNSTDPESSRKKAKTGWIIFAVNFGVVVLLGIVALGLLIATGNNFDTEFSY